MRQNLAWKYIKASKRRSILTIFGIAMALAMMMCIGNAISTVLDSSQKELAERFGSWDTMFQGMGEGATLESLRAEEKVEHVSAIYENTNFTIPSLREEDITDEDWLSESQWNNFISIDPAATEVMDIAFEQGGFPADSSQVAVGYNLAQEMDLQVGDSISLEAGDIFVEDYYDEVQEEFITSASFSGEPRTLQISGIIAKEGNQGLFDGGIRVIIAGPMASAPHDFLVRFQKGTNVVTNSEALADKYSGMLSINQAVYTKSFSSMMTQMFVFGVLFVFCCCLIAFAAISIVRNSFSMSVTERMRDYGLLRCAGATQKQIRALIRSEVFILLAIAFPLSLVISYIASAGVLAIVNSMDLMGMPHFDLSVSWFFILLSLGISLVSMVIAVVGPSRKASNVSPIMITTGQDLAPGVDKAVAKKSKLGRLLGVEWDLASRNRRAAGKRSRTTVFSMTVSVMLMIATMGMMQTYLLPEMQQAESEIDILARMYLEQETEEFDDEDFAEYCKQVASMDGVTHNASVREVHLNAYSSPRDLTNPDLIEDIYGQYEGKLSTNLWVKYIGRNEYKQLQAGNGELANLSYDQWLEQGGGLLNDNVVSTKYNDYGRALQTAHHQMFSLQGAGELNVNVLNRLSEVAHANDDDSTTVLYTNNEDNQPTQSLTFAINRRINNRAWFDDISYAAQNSIIYLPEERWAEDIGQYEETDGYAEYSAYAKTVPDKNDAVAEAMGEIDTNESVYVSNLYREELVIRNIILLVSICVYSFVGVIALISCLNIINIIGTNLVLRKRDFGLLQAVGMNVAQMRKMIVFECVQFSLRSMLYGSILGFAALAALHTVINANTTMAFYISPWSVLGIFAACFMVSIIASWPTWKKMKKVSIMESIRHIG